MPRPQFTLRALLVAMLVVAAPCAWLAHNVSLVRQRRAILQQYENGGPPWVTTILDEETEPKDLPWIRRALGDVPVPSLYCDNGDDNDPFIRQLRGLFPEATIVLPGEVKIKLLPPESQLRRPKR